MNKKTMAITIAFAVVLIVSLVMSITSLALLTKANDRLDELDKNNPTLNADVAALLTQVKDLNAKLTTANGTITSLAAQIDELKDKLGASDATVKDLTDKLTAASANIGALESDVTALNAEIEDLTIKGETADAKIAELTAKLAETSYRLEAETLNSSMIPLSYSVDTLFAKSDAELSPASFTKEVNDVNAAAKSIKTSIDALTPPSTELESVKTDTTARFSEIESAYTANLATFATTATTTGAGIKTVPNTLNMYVIPSFANAAPVTVNAQRLNADAVDKTLSEAACLTMPYYGTYNVTLSSGDSTSIKTLNVYADSYNLAALNATFPVTMFTLDLWNINTVPTYVFLERTTSWDWSKLPENVYSFGITAELEFHNNRAKMQAYIGELYKGNPNAEFTLYTNDIYTENSLWMYQNNIPESQFSIKLLSDGTGSYNSFNAKLGANSQFNQSTYDEMKTNWATIKSRALAGQSLEQCVNGITHMHPGIYSTMVYYSYVVANEESNITWLLARPSLLNGYNNSSFDKTSIVSVNLGNSLTAITANGLEAELKSLYKFDEDAFVDGIASGKKIMMLLGTNVDKDVYAKFLQFYCGNEYYIYYKGHPMNQANEALKEHYKSMGIDTSLNMSLPAELLIFYNPEISAAGYPSSTFENISSECKVLFESKAAAANRPYKAEVYVSIVAGTNDEIIMVEYADENKAAQYWSMTTNDYCENPNPVA